MALADTLTSATIHRSTSGKDDRHYTSLAVQAQSQCRLQIPIHSDEYGGGNQFTASILDGSSNVLASNDFITRYIVFC